MLSIAGLCNMDFVQFLFPILLFYAAWSLVVLGIPILLVGLIGSRKTGKIDLPLGIKLSLGGGFVFCLFLSEYSFREAFKMHDFEELAALLTMAFVIALTMSIAAFLSFTVGSSFGLLVNRLRGRNS